MSGNKLKTQRTLIIVLILFLSFLTLAYMENTNFLTIETSYVGIQDGNLMLQGLLYKPAGVSATNQRPGIVLAHGIANSKEVVSGFALELAKRGFIALALDEVAHGNSEGNLYTARQTDSSLGVLSAVNWLQSQPFVNKSQIAVVGHSMGAGAVLEAGLNDTSIKATVLIGGGVNGTLTASSGMNATNPHNMLLIIGQFDVLFNIHDLMTSSGLQSVFNTTATIQENTLYGSFQNQNARKFVVIPGTHLLEVISPQSISAITDWLSHSLNFTITNPSSDYTSSLIRDLFLIVALFFFVWLFLEVGKLVLSKIKNNKSTDEIEGVKRGNPYLLGISWGVLSLILFLPSEIVGVIIVFPPLIFGSIFTFWHLFTAIGAVILLIIYQKYKKVTFTTKVLIKSFVENKNFIYIAFGLFIFIYIVVIMMEEFLQLNFKLFIPVLDEIGPSDRIILFILVVPYTFIFFYFQNVFFYNLSDYKDFKSLKTLGLQLLMNIGPFLLVLVIFYLPILLFSTVLIHGTTGFFTEFLDPVVPVFAIATWINWFFYKETKRITIGTILNCLLVALTISSLFPIVL